MKKILLSKLTLSLIIGSSVFNPSFAQSLTNKSVKDNADSSVIYKCQDSFGKVSYLNVNDKKGKCERTDLSNPAKMMVVENHDRKKVTYTPSQINSSNKNTQTRKINNQLAQEQYLRDQKRLSILNEELKNEKEQQKTIDNMIKNVGSDKDQLERLQSMKSNHQKNISSLTKEIATIKNKKPVRNPTPPAPKPMDVDIEKRFIESGEVPINVLNTNPDISEVREGNLPIDLPIS